MVGSSRLNPLSWWSTCSYTGERRKLTIPTRRNRLLIDTIILGIVGALSAQAFTFLLGWSQTFFLNWLAGYQLPTVSPDGSVNTSVHTVWWIPVATTLGGLLAGFLIYSFSPEAEGHGTDAAVNAYHNLRGVIRARVPIVKTIASALTIGSGGSAGREGPTALISAGVASVYARKRGRSDHETRLLVLVGMAAGLSAIFRSPIGTAIFAIEVLYSDMDFESGALVFTMLGSILAYTINGFFVGFRPLFDVSADVAVPTAGAYGWYVVLGIACGLVATVLPMALYGVRDLFRRIPCPPHFKPALGGLGVGLIALALPQLLGGGYGWIQAAIHGSLPTRLLIFLALGKIVTFALTIGSGGSGGVFAPSLFTGAMVGGFFSSVLHLSPAAFAVVGMAAVFGAAGRVPIATFLMVTEMTGGYGLLVAAALAVTLSSVVQTLLSGSLKYKSLYQAQVPSRPYSPSHYLEHLRIALELLKTPGFSTALDGERLELAPLLSNGVPVSLAEGKEIRIGTLKPKSPCVGHSIVDGCFGGSRDVEFILVVRGDRSFLPGPEVRMEPGDVIIAVASDSAWGRLSEHFAPVEPPSRHTTHETHSSVRGSLL
jgi:CIC family chloride channel protein